MTIPVTGIQRMRRIYKVCLALTQMQESMRRNALTHRAAAVARSVPVSKLAGDIQDCASEYARFVGYVNDAMGDQRRPALDAALSAAGMSSADVMDYTAAMSGAIDRLATAAASITTYARVIAVCDAILDEVDAVEDPIEVWPE